MIVFNCDLKIPSDLLYSDMIDLLPAVYTDIQILTVKLPLLLEEINKVELSLPDVEKDVHLLLENHPIVTEAKVFVFIFTGLT